MIKIGIMLKRCKVVSPSDLTTLTWGSQTDNKTFEQIEKYVSLC